MPTPARSSRVGRGGHLEPRLGRLSPREAEAALQGLVALDLVQLRAGAAPVSPGLARGALRYVEEDPLEEWQSVREIWSSGGGDCEDLAAAVAAERTLRGAPSRVRILRIRPGLLHAVVEDLRTRRIFDPSVLGGMRPWW